MSIRTEFGQIDLDQVTQVIIKFEQAYSNLKEENKFLKSELEARDSLLMEVFDRSETLSGDLEKRIYKLLRKK